MSERCHNCGAELFAGQQFCRRCGVAVAAPRGQGGGDAPTQLFPQAGETSGAAPRVTGDTGQPHVATAQLGPGQQTDAFGRGLPTAHQPPLASYRQTSHLSAQGPPRPPRKRRWLLWSSVIFAGLTFCVMALVIAFLVSRGGGRPNKVVVVKKGAHAGHPGEAPAPPLPPNLPERIREAIASAGVPLPMDEAGASVTGDQTVFTRSFEVGGDGAVNFRGTAGDVTVVGTDGSEVEVRVTKRGGSAEERRGLRVLFSKTDDGLLLITTARPEGRVKVSCEIRLPRNLRRLDVAAEAGRVKVQDFGGEVEVELKNGDIEIAASGPVRSRLTNGSTKVSYAGQRDEPQEFSVTNGNVEVSFGGEPAASLKAETENGDIKLDGAFGGLKAEKHASGRRLEADLGGGGAPLAVKVMKGDIKLKS